MRPTSDVLGGVSRITFQMSTASLETAVKQRSIDLLGTEVALIIRAPTAQDAPKPDVVKNGKIIPS
jgi:hypothetical protein